MPADQEGTRTTSLHRDISDAVVRITAEYTGRGPTRARTTINGDWTPMSTRTSRSNPSTCPRTPVAHEFAGLVNDRPAV